MGKSTHKVFAHQDDVSVVIRRSLLTDPMEHEPVSVFAKGLKGHQYIGEFTVKSQPAHGLKLRIYTNGEMIFKRIIPPSGVIGNLPLEADQSYIISLK